MQMAGRYLLDTNIVVRLFAKDQVVLDWLKEVSEIFVPCVVMGELLYGAQKSAKTDTNTAKIIEFSSQVRVLPCDTDTAFYYGNIKNLLRAKGRPIPENDIWIGSIAKQHKLTLATGDMHFKEIEGIKLAEF